jgi:hypothetical protein
MVGPGAAQFIFHIMIIIIKTKKQKKIIPRVISKYL